MNGNHVVVENNSGMSSVSANVSLAYMDDFIRLRCAPDLLRLGLFPNAAEITETMAIWAAFRRMCEQLRTKTTTNKTHNNNNDIANSSSDGKSDKSNLDDKDDKQESSSLDDAVIVIGDGTTPRTASFLSMMTRGGETTLPKPAFGRCWRFISIDPLLYYDSRLQRIWLKKASRTLQPEMVEQWTTANIRGLECVRSQIQKVTIRARRAIIVLLHAHVSLYDACKSLDLSQGLVGAVVSPCCNWEPVLRHLYGRVADYEIEDKRMLSAKNLVRFWAQSPCTPEALQPQGGVTPEYVYKEQYGELKQRKVENSKERTTKALTARRGQPQRARENLRHLLQCPVPCLIEQVELSVAACRLLPNKAGAIALALELTIKETLTGLKDLKNADVRVEVHNDGAQVVTAVAASGEGSGRFSVHVSGEEQREGLLMQTWGVIAASRVGAALVFYDLHILDTVTGTVEEVCTGKNEEGRAQAQVQWQSCIPSLEQEEDILRHIRAHAKSCDVASAIYATKGGKRGLPLAPTLPQQPVSQKLQLCVARSSKWANMTSSDISSPLPDVLHPILPKESEAPWLTDLRPSDVVLVSGLLGYTIHGNFLLFVQDGLLLYDSVSQVGACDFKQDGSIITGEAIEAEVDNKWRYCRRRVI